MENPNSDYIKLAKSMSQEHLKAQKKSRVFEWWKTHWLAIVALIVAIVALVKDW